jgi:hypothetical protein
VSGKWSHSLQLVDMQGFGDLPGSDTSKYWFHIVLPFWLNLGRRRKLPSANSEGEIPSGRDGSHSKTESSQGQAELETVELWY